MPSRELTAANYDELLRIFLGRDDLRPAMQQANKVSDTVYSTDAHSMLMVPADKVGLEYPPHARTPDYASVLKQVKECDPIVYKDTDLFKVLEECPKEYDTEPCPDCYGEGRCPPCGHDCSRCDGDGSIEDKSLPMVHASSKIGVRIGEQVFAPLQLAKLEKVVLSMLSDTFEVVGTSAVVTLFKVCDVTIMIARLQTDGDYESTMKEIFDLHPAKK